MLKKFEKKYPFIRVRRYNVKEREGIEMLYALCEKYKVHPRMCVVPIIFVGYNYIPYFQISEKWIKHYIEKYADRKVEPPWKQAAPFLDTARLKIRAVFEKIKIINIISAGLIDGINPCAFATLIFLLSFLTYRQTEEKKIIFIALSFIIGIFTIYFLIGIGFFETVLLLNYQIIKKYIYPITIIILIIFAGFSFYDAYISRKNISQQILKLPGKLHRIMHMLIKSKISNISLGFITGILIGGLEFGCTGQIYLPTIIYMTAVPSLKFKAYSYLVLYNVCFITPLIAIACLTKIYSIEKISKFLRKNNFWIKLALGFIFIFLAISLKIWAI